MDEIGVVKRLSELGFTEDTIDDAVISLATLSASRRSSSCMLTVPSWDLGKRTVVHMLLPQSLHVTRERRTELGLKPTHWFKPCHCLALHTGSQSVTSVSVSRPARP